MNKISAPMAKGSETSGTTLMDDTFMHGSICQEVKAERDRADHDFISSVLCLSTTLC